MFGTLDAEASDVEHSAADARVAAVLALYRRLALFVAENLNHMHVEETENNAALWATYSDSELAAIEQGLVAAIPPERKAMFLRWMVPAAAPAERAAMLTKLQLGAPAGAFEAVLAIVKPHLSGRDWSKLMAALGPMPG
jgi:hypothetical protein